MTHEIIIPDKSSTHKKLSNPDLFAVAKDEIDKWDKISRKLRVLFHKDSITSQFNSYEDFAEFNWKEYMKKQRQGERLQFIPWGTHSPLPLTWKRSWSETHSGVIQELLGRKNSKTTEIYTHVGMKDLRKIKNPLDTMVKSEKDIRFHSYCKNQTKSEFPIFPNN